MNCPKCGKELEVSVNIYAKDYNYQDIDFRCSEDETHSYFVRIKEEDLLEG